MLQTTPKMPSKAGVSRAEIAAHAFDCSNSVPATPRRLRRGSTHIRSLQEIEPSAVFCIAFPSWALNCLAAIPLSLCFHPPPQPGCLEPRPQRPAHKVTEPT